MKKVKLKVIGDGSYANPYRADVKLGVTHNVGDIILHNIEVDEKGKPKKAEVEVIIYEKGVDF